MPRTIAFEPGFFTRSTVSVARDLLGTLLVSEVGGEVTAGTVVETEAYGGPEDPASHAAAKAGRTPRNDSMFGPPGRAYVYVIYGMHWCLNVVTRPDGEAGAVLIRGLVPERGLDEMRRRRGGRSPIAAGPARLTQALGVTGAFDGHDLSLPPLRLVPGEHVADRAVRTSCRIGVAKARNRPHRCHVAGSPGVTPTRAR